jgi:hypothetical protein
MSGFSRLYSSVFKHIGLFRKLLFGSNTFAEDRKNKHMDKLEINMLLYSYCIHTSNRIIPTAAILTCVSRLQPLQGQRWFAHKHIIQLFIFPFFIPSFSLFSILFTIIPHLCIYFYLFYSLTHYFLFSTGLFSPPSLTIMLSSCTSDHKAFLILAETCIFVQFK